MLPFTIFTISSYLHPVMAQTPYVMIWSSDTYGPDGPWNAISVDVGTLRQSLALYPGGNWEPTILLPALCTNTSISSKCYAKDAGIYNAEDSLTWDNSTIQQASDGNWQNYTLGFAEDVPIYASAQRAMDTITLWNGVTVPRVSLIGISQGYQTYPDGQNYPLEVGVLSLGANEVNQTFTVNDTHAVEANLVTGWLYESVRIPSYSYGMHIGSAAQKIPGSLLLGGYDVTRVLGNVSSQPYNETKFPIQLLDIGIGVVTGDSPWNSSNITGLLSVGRSSIQQQQQQGLGAKVLITGADPYIYLPQSTCDAITNHLPVAYNSSLGLYFWNTHETQYLKIVKSPNYLWFTFAANASTDTKSNITIKVPFALLDLKLEPPLVHEPTSYFPCMGTTNGPYVLGRAFLQAAFFGVNWAMKGNGNGNWFLSKNVISIHEANETLIGSFAQDWEETWVDHWTPLTNTDNSTFIGSSSGSGGGGISTDTITIICGAVGGVFGLILTMSVIWCGCLRRSEHGGYSQPREQEEHNQSQEQQEEYHRRREQEYNQRRQQPPSYSDQVVNYHVDNGGLASSVVTEPQKAVQPHQTQTRYTEHAQQTGTSRTERREASRTRVVTRNERGTA